MIILRKLFAWQIKLEQGCNSLLQHLVPGMDAGMLRWVWMLLYGVVFLGCLGATACVLIFMGWMTALTYLDVQDNYYPRVSREALHSPEYVGRRVRFVIPELHTEERLMLSNGRSISAMRLGPRFASQLYSGDIRLTVEDGRSICFFMPHEEMCAELESMLRREGLVGENIAELESMLCRMSSQGVEHNPVLCDYLPAHLCCEIRVKGQLRAPGEVLVKSLNSGLYMHFFGSVIQLIGAGFCVLCSLMGTWGILWSARSGFRHQRRGGYEPPVGLCASTLLHGGSLLVLAYILGYAGYELFLAEKASSFAPYHFHPELQYMLSVVGILLLQMIYFRLRSTRSSVKTAQ